MSITHRINWFLNNPKTPKWLSHIRLWFIKPENVIPDHLYCYSGGRGTNKYKPCIFWYKDYNRTEMDSGYCALTRVADWDYGCGLLWDQCKVCGINEYTIINIDDIMLWVLEKDINIL
jgi:hypothetical protein